MLVLIARDICHLVFGKLKQQIQLTYTLPLYLYYAAGVGLENEAKAPWRLDSRGKEFPLLMDCVKLRHLVHTRSGTESARSSRSSRTREK